MRALARQLTILLVLSLGVFCGACDDEPPVDDFMCADHGDCLLAPGGRCEEDPDTGKMECRYPDAVDAGASATTCNTVDTKSHLPTIPTLPRHSSPSP